MLDREAFPFVVQGFYAFYDGLEVGNVRREVNPRLLEDDG